MSFVTNRRCPTFSLIVTLVWLCSGAPASAKKHEPAKNDNEAAGSVERSYRKFFMHVRVNRCITDYGLDTLDVQSFVESILTGNQLRHRFEQRGYKYENKRYYLDAADKDYTNLDQFIEYNAENIDHIIANNDYSHMYLVSIACLPHGEAHKYRLVVSMINRDQIKSLLERHKDKKNHYNPNKSSGDAVEYDTNDLDNLSDDLTNGIYRSFFRLLRVPNIEAVSDIRNYDPGDKIEQFFQLRMNLDPQIDPRANEELLGKFQVDYSIYEINGDQVQSICSAPDANLALLDCATRTAKDDELCSAQDLEQLQVQKKLSQRTRPHVERDPRTDAFRGGVRIIYRSTPSPATYLFRALAVVTNKEGVTQVESRPAYRCVQTRPRSLRMTLGVRAGFPVDLNQNAGTSSLPAASLLFPALSLDVGTSFFVTARRSPWFSDVYIGPSIGFSWLNGLYPCPDRSLSCPDVVKVPRYKTFSTAWSADIRGNIDSNLFRHNRMVVRLLSNFGVGIESLRSTVKPFSRDGIHPLLLIGFGFAVGGENLFRTRVGINTHFGLIAEVRTRMERTTNEVSNSFLRAESAGVPDSVFIFWLLYKAEFSLPHSQKNAWKNSR